MQSLTISLIQSDLHWQDPQANVKMFDQKINTIPNNTDIIVLPEMFNVGFVTQPSSCAEQMYGQSFTWLKNKALEKSCVICGSLLIKDAGKYYNRFIWMMPSGEFTYYDKKHLFRYAGEHEKITAGKNKIITNLKGWNFFPVICYDIRFPVWCKNNYSPKGVFDYDIMIVVANWPGNRSHSWSTLLMARAIENVSYVIGVNRIGKDGKGIEYSGDSVVVNPKGEIISSIKPGNNQIETITLSGKEPENSRNTFRFADDWDKFKLLQNPDPT